MHPCTQPAASEAVSAAQPAAQGDEGAQVHTDQDDSPCTSGANPPRGRALFAFAGVPMPLASSAEVGPRQQCQALCQRILLALRFIKNAGVSRAQCSTPGALEDLSVTQRRRGEYTQHASKLRQTITKFWMVMRASCAPELCGNPNQSSDEMEDKQQQLQQIDTAVRCPGLSLPQSSNTAAVAASAICATSVPVTGLSGGTIGEAEYVELHLRVAKALQNHWHMSEALQVAHQDWFSDLHRGPSSQPGVPICCQPDEEAARQRTPNRLDFPGFFEALYELADHWTHGVSPLEFDAFLSAIFAAITVGSAPGGIEEVDGALGTAARVRLRGLEYNHTTAYYEFKEIDEISPVPLESLLPAISSPDTQNVQPETRPVMAPSEADVCEIEHNQDGCDPLRNSALEQAEEWIAHARLYSTPPLPPTPPELSIAPPTLQIVSNSDLKPAHTHGNSSRRRRRRRRRHGRCKAPKSGVVEQTCLTSSKRSSTATHATQRDQPGGRHIQRGRRQCRYQPGRNLSAKAQPRLNDTRQRLTDNAQQLQEAASNVHASATSVDSTSKMAKLFPPLCIQPAPHKQQQNRCRCRLRRKSPSPPPSTKALGKPPCRGGPMGATHCRCRRCRCLLPTSLCSQQMPCFKECATLTDTFTAHMGWGKVYEPRTHSQRCNSSIHCASSVHPWLND